MSPGFVEVLKTEDNYELMKSVRISNHKVGFRLASRFSPLLCSCLEGIPLTLSSLNENELFSLSLITLPESL